MVSLKEPSKRESEDTEEVGRKRVAHLSAAAGISRQVGPSQPPKKLVNPQQKMYERWRLMREATAAANQKATENADAKSQVTSMSALRSLSKVHKEHIKSISSVSSSYLQSNGNGKWDILETVYCNLVNRESMS